MLKDASELPLQSSEEADVCILGGGAAGITLARQLNATKLRVLLVESGSFDPEPETQALASGDVVGHQYWALHTSRLRYFGGTTNHWTGWCRPLDPLDFEQRAWVEHSGWPISYSDLEPYYRAAQEVCELGPLDYAPNTWAKSIKQPLLDRDLNGFRSVTWQFSPPTRFGARYRKELVDSDNVTILLRANAVYLKLNGTTSRIDAVRAKTLNNNEIVLKARAYVLALGGLDNPRLLLASSDVAHAGLGNENDMVGRFFSDHPHTVLGALITDEPKEVTRAYGDLVNTEDKRPAAVRFTLALTEEMQRDRKLLGCCINLEPPQRTAFRASDARGVKSLMEQLDKRWARQTFELFARAEQAPTHDSRVYLSWRRDPFGLPRVALDWSIDEKTVASLKGSVELLAAAVGRAGLGRVYSYAHREEKLKQAWPELWGGHHHMGTTRMSHDPRHGVVDPDCRVHGVDNLYCAGSSVFTTTGYANPTLTIVALAARLAEHLKGRLA